MSKTEAQEVLSEHWEMFFTFMVTKPWHRLPGEVMKPLSLEIIKSSLDIVLGKWL